MSLEITLRDIQPRDYADITYLIGELGYPSTQEKVSERLNRIAQENTYKTLVAAANGDIIGFIGLNKSLAYEEDGCYVRVVALVVNDKYRNCGIGTKLIQAAEKWAVSVGASGIALNSSIKRKEAHEFYKNRGYSITEYGFSKKLIIEK